MWLLAKWLALSVPAVYTNSMIKYAHDTHTHTPHTTHNESS